MRSSCEVSANLSAVSAKPGAVTRITHGAASIPIMVTTASAGSVAQRRKRQKRGSHPHPLLAFIFRENRHKCLRKCPFRKNTTQQIWQFERDEKGVRRHSAPKTLATIASRAKPSTRENMVIELTAASDFNKFINVNFQNHTDL